MSPALSAGVWRVAPLVVVKEARVEVEVGEVLGAGIAVVLIGPVWARNGHPSQIIRDRSEVLTPPRCGSVRYRRTRNLTGGAFQGDKDNALSERIRDLGCDCQVLQCQPQHDIKADSVARSACRELP